MVGFGFHELFKKYPLYHKLGNVFYRQGFTRPMISFLDGYFKDKYGLVGVEIGVQRGFHTLNIFSVLGDRVEKMYLIDPWAEYTELGISHDWSGCLSVAKRVLRVFNGRCVFIKGYSQDMEVVDKVRDGSVDFVYIDGNHDYKTTKADILNFFPKVRVGGIFGGHDMSIGAPGVIQAVQEFVGESGLRLYGIASDWWVIKE